MEFLLNMLGKVRLSEDVELVVFSQYTKIIRYNIRGRRSVNIPRAVIRWSLQNQQQINQLVVLDEEGVQLQTSYRGWRVAKSLFPDNDVTYVGYAKYRGQERIG